MPTQLGLTQHEEKTQCRSSEQHWVLFSLAFVVGRCGQLECQLHLKAVDEFTRLFIGKLVRLEEVAEVALDFQIVSNDVLGNPYCVHVLQITARRLLRSDGGVSRCKFKIAWQEVACLDYNSAARVVVGDEVVFRVD